MTHSDRITHSASAFRKDRPRVSRDVQQTALAISGMRNNACRERVTAALEGVRGVYDVNVSLIRARASVVHDATCDVESLIAAIAEAGYVAVVDTPLTKS